MPARHLDRLSASDAAFLVEEDRGAHMHIGWVMIAGGPPPSHDALMAHVKARLDIVPRYRQKLCYPPLQIGRPFWVDDPRFNLEYHVRHTALPAPGSLNQLRMLSGRIFSQDLDRSKPLWELWLVQGLEGNRFAIINKSHRAMVGGDTGLDLTSVVLDTTRHPKASTTRRHEWIPRPEPNSAELLAAGVRDAINAPAQIAAQVWEELGNPDVALASAQQVFAGLREVVAAYFDPPSPTPLNVRIGTHRRVFWTRYPLHEFRAIKDVLGATVNDVYLAVLTGALSRWLRHRGIHTKNLHMRAAVPVSLRVPRADGDDITRVVECFAPLPVDCNDPEERVHIVHHALEDLKSSKQALGARAIAAVQSFTPPVLLGQVSRLRFSSRLFNLVAANVPGPQFPLYLLGHEVEQIGPVGFLLDNSALMAVMVSYNGMLELGLTADPDAVPDLDDLGNALDDAVDELRQVAAAMTAAKPRKKKRRPTKQHVSPQPSA